MLIVWHLPGEGDESKYILDPPVKLGTEDSSIKNLGQLIAKFGPPQQLYISPFEISRNTHAQIKEKLKEYKVRIQIEPRLGRHILLDEDIALVRETTLNKGFRMYVGESKSNFESRVKACLEYYRSLSLKGNIWFLTHSDVFRCIAKLENTPTRAVLSQTSYIEVSPFLSNITREIAPEISFSRPSSSKPPPKPQKKKSSKKKSKKKSSHRRKSRHDVSIGFPEERKAFDMSSDDDSDSSSDESSSSDDMRRLPKYSRIRPMYKSARTMVNTQSTISHIGYTRKNPDLSGSDGDDSRYNIFLE